MGTVIKCFLFWTSEFEVAGDKLWTRLHVV